MEKIILWGTGKIAAKLLRAISDTIVLVVDNDPRKWGMIWNKYVINKPSVIMEFDGDFDRIVIATLDWKDIRRQILEEFDIEPYRIDNMYYRQRSELLNCYKKNKKYDKEKYISFLEQHPLEVFNDCFTEKYVNPELKIYFDSEKSLYFLYHHNKKMYFASRYSTPEKVKKYYSSLLMEQDVSSPHRYQTEQFYVHKHDVVLDAGVAEGNFALDIIELIDKLYLVECDREWLRALECTFEPYKDKVEIVEGFLGDGSKESRTVDSIIGDNKVDFIKMDIEGAEWSALHGAKKSLNQNDVRLAICVYHNADDEEKIGKLLKETGYDTEVSEGYMIFITEQFLEKEVILPKFVRGIIRGKKKETQTC